MKEMHFSIWTDHSKILQGKGHLGVQTKTLKVICLFNDLGFVLFLKRMMVLDLFYGATLNFFEL